MFEKEVLVDHEVGCLSVQWYEDIPVLHLQIHKWSHNIFKKIILPLWAQALEELKERGAYVVLAIIPSHEKKIAKFHALLGMHEATDDGEYIVSRRWL
jgi:hypothetical protein